jgi:hypothetical protein
VAAAGGTGTTVSALEGTAWMIALVLLMFGVSWLADRTTVVGQARVTKSAEVLADYAAALVTPLDTASHGKTRHQVSTTTAACWMVCRSRRTSRGLARLAHGTLPVVRFESHQRPRSDPYHPLGPITVKIRHRSTPATRHRAR